jgi:hypothetical protein
VVEVVGVEVGVVGVVISLTYISLRVANHANQRL